MLTFCLQLAFSSQRSLAGTSQAISVWATISPSLNGILDQVVAGDIDLVLGHWKSSYFHQLVEHRHILRDNLLPVADPAGTPHTTLLDSSRSSRCCNVYIAARKISVALSLDGLMCLARDSPALSVSDPSRTLAALYCSFRRHRRRQRSLHHMGP
ncbi:hypothetical protein KL932_005404 [Ogataea haglerorum]|nr:hypothetical protein KL932_005404 [Ogataea haglerorum]